VTARVGSDSGADSPGAAIGETAAGPGHSPEPPVALVDHSRPPPRIRHWPPRREIHSDTPAGMQPLVWAEDVLQYAVAAVLMITAFVVLGRSLYAAMFETEPFAKQIPDLIDAVLFVIIVLEIFTTVLSHFHEGGLQLRPFLVIGIISAVRHILVVGARASLGGTVVDFQRTMIELGVNTGIVLGLVLALILVAHFDRRHDRD
jgi:uncharacterized membrane protein (DUF373 family)